MTCRHGRGDPECSSHPDNVARQRVEALNQEHNRSKAALVTEIERLKDMVPPTPDSDNYSIEDVVQVGPHLVMKVRYPNCKKCSFEGDKVMVFVSVSTLDALKWKKIDPHFRDSRAVSHRESPSPAARFPASETGWRDALAYAAFIAERGMEP